MPKIRTSSKKSAEKSVEFLTVQFKKQPTKFSSDKRAESIWLF